MVEKEWSSTLVKELNQEIHGLRAENSDLKFHLYLHFPEFVVGKDHILPSGGSSDGLEHYHHSNNHHPHPPRKTVRDATTLTEDSFIIKEQQDCNECRDVVSPKRKDLERVHLLKELEKAEQLISKLKWNHVNQAEKFIMQNMKIQDLQREIQHLRASGLEIFSLQIHPPLSSRKTRTDTTCSTPTSTPPARRRHNSFSSVTQQQRRSLVSTESVLPDDYKESVSTLPPIGVGDLLTKLNNIPLQDTKLPKFRAPPLPLPGSTTTASISKSHSPLKPLKGLLRRESHAT